ncbi:MAG: glycosyl transferase family 2 [Fibrobacteria bacterium]|jgi:GT2 family glycosyltransferase|nr:glycosyl transferase family 2 [Fibrobacteria bacterium]
MRTSIVIITWNSAGVLPDCVSSIRAHVPPAERDIVIVDNASRDTGYLDAYREAPDVRVILSPENLGYARAVNRGLEKASGEHFLILNPDIVFRGNPLPGLAAALERDPRLGAVGPLLRDASGAPQVAGYYRKFPTPLHYLLNDTILSRWSGIARLAGRLSHARVRETGVQYVDQIPGAFLFFRNDAFEPGAWMNEAYFLWMEDVDFCRRLWKAGRRVAVAADESVTHLGGTSFRQREDAWKRRVFMESYLTYVNLNAGGTVRWMFRAIMALDSAGRLLLHALRGFRDPARRPALAGEFGVLKRILGRSGR